MKNLILAVLFSGALFTVSCKKHKDDPNPKSLNVYVAGVQMDPGSGREMSTVWKNGTPQTDALVGNRSYYAHAIAVSGNDVYTTGYENTPTHWQCHVWKNGQGHYQLGTGYSYGKGIAVSGTDIYVAGNTYDGTPSGHSAVLWKNNTAVNIIATGNSTVANAMVIAGSDIYVGGKESGDGRIWKNGISLPLNNASGYEISTIAVSGTDVYASGYSAASTIRYWKNGAFTDITTAGPAFISAMAVYNNDVYLAGWELVAGKAVAKYWKNGTAVILGDGVRNSIANGIAIKDNDVYVVGNVQGATNLSDYATLWKNGQATTIGTINSRAHAIAVQ
jgi:hypothetical protein